MGPLQGHGKQGRCWVTWEMGCPEGETRAHSTARRNKRKSAGDQTKFVGGTRCYIGTDE